MSETARRIENPFDKAMAVITGASLWAGRHSLDGEGAEQLCADGMPG